MMERVKDGARKTGKRAERAFVSRLVTPAIVGAATFLGAQEFGHQNFWDSAQLAGGAAFFGSSLVESFYRGKPSSLTFPLFAALTAEAASMYTGHNDLITPGYFVIGGTAFIGEKVVGNTFSSGKSRRG